MSGHYFGSVWYFLAAAAIIAIGWCTTNASGDIGPHGTNLPWVQKPIGASFGVCGGAGTGSARMCELPFLEFDCPGCAAMQENPRVVRQPVLSWVYVGEGSCWARVVKLFEGWCFLLEIIVVTSSSDVSVGGHGWRSKLEEQEFGSEFAKCPPVSTAGSLCWQRQKTCQQNAHTVFEPSEYDLSGGPTLLIRGFEMGFCDDIQPDVCFSSLNSLRKWPKRNLFLSWLLQWRRLFQSLCNTCAPWMMTSGTWIATAASECLKIMMFGSGPKLLLGYEGWCGAWHGMLLDCVTLPVLSGSVLSMHLAWSSRLWEKVFCDSGCMTVLPSDIFTHRLCHWSLLEAGHCWCL